LPSRKVIAGGLVAGALVLGAAPAYAAFSPSLTGAGPSSVKGTEATAVFQIGDDTIRQVRYADRKTLTYTFELVNDGLLPIKVEGIAQPKVKPTLFDYKSLKSGDKSTFTVGAGDRRLVTLSLFMQSCERLSSRAGSFVKDVHVRTSSVGINRTVVVTLPEQIHSGSPREAKCPDATANSRPPG
jgi:hypothetical protein